MQDSLFGEPEDSAPAASKPKRGSGKVQAAAIDPALNALATALPSKLRLGTSSWNYPGWIGSVWAQDYPEASLSKYGLPAYAQHPLFRSVSLDRGFYRPLSMVQYAGYAAQVPDDFRFVVKAPSLVCDAMVRDETGHGMIVNRNFLDPELAIREFVQPALDGLVHKIGALVFQLSPLPPPWLDRLPALLANLDRMLKALPALQPGAPDGVIAIEVRNPEFLIAPYAAEFIRVLRDNSATYCLGLHAKMPSIAGQLPILRALWPGPLVCRWNLNPLHGAYGYEDAKQLYAPFDKLVDPDLETRNSLARVIVGTTGAGQNAFVTVSNKAEGSAPLTVAALAKVVAAG